MKCYRRTAGDGHKYTSCDGKKKAGQLEKKKGKRVPIKSEATKKKLGKTHFRVMEKKEAKKEAKKPVKKKKKKKEPEDYKPRGKMNVEKKRHLTRGATKKDKEAIGGFIKKHKKDLDTSRYKKKK